LQADKLASKLLQNSVKSIERLLLRQSYKEIAIIEKGRWHSHCEFRNQYFGASNPFASINRLGEEKEKN